MNAGTGRFVRVSVTGGTGGDASPVFADGYAYIRSPGQFQDAVEEAVRTCLADLMIRDLAEAQSRMEGVSGVIAP